MPVLSDLFRGGGRGLAGDRGGGRNMGASRIVPFFSMSPVVPCVGRVVLYRWGSVFLSSVVSSFRFLQCRGGRRAAGRRSGRSGVCGEWAAAERLRRDIGPGPVAGCRREADRRRLLRKRKGRGTVAGLGRDAGGNFGKLPIFIAASPPGFRSRFASGTGGTVKWKRI